MMTSLWTFFVLLAVTAGASRAQDLPPDEEPVPVPVAPMRIGAADIWLLPDVNREVVKIRFSGVSSSESGLSATQFLEDAKKKLKAIIPRRVREPNR